MVNKTVFALKRAFSHVESMKDHLCRGRLYNTVHQAWTTANCVTASLRTVAASIVFLAKVKSCDCYAGSFYWIRVFYASSERFMPK